MPTALDIKILPKVQEVIAKYGKAITWTVKSGGTYNPSTGAVSGETTTNHTVKVTPPEPYESRYVDGDVVREGDAKVFVAGKDLAFVPAEGQVLTIDGATWRVVRVNAIYSGEQIACWEASVRR